MTRIVRSAARMMAVSAMLLAATAPALSQATSQDMNRDPSRDFAKLKIDIDVVLKEAKVVLNLDHIAFAGKEPFGLLYARLMHERFTADKTAAKVRLIFGGAVLDHRAFYRQVVTGS